MAPLKVVSPAFLLWSQSLLLWGIAAYGVVADPLRGETVHIRWKRWMLVLSVRAIPGAALTYAVSRSILLSGVFLFTVLLQPLLRYCLPVRLIAEFESLSIAAIMVCGLGVIRYLHLTPRWVPGSISPAQLAALCIFASTLLVVVRGGTYIVRGILRKSGTLPSEGRLDEVPKRSPTSSESSPLAETRSAVASIAASADEPAQGTVDTKEYNRGRLIGNLERIVLTIVIAAGSYAALAFLVAAKGVVRSDEFDKDRDFAEYFLIGSLSSVLVALCAGIALRFALIRLWPDLLGLQIQ
ncbi:MAG: hypothetical protein WBQ85_03175 [Candidatus Sulfotelmatobacter sp.]